MIGSRLSLPYTGSHLFYGDNLDILRNHIPDESVDLVYLDPPFNSQATYNVLFKAPGGDSSQAQIEAFEDTWHWNESAERAFDEVVTSQHSDAAIMLRAMRSALGENDMMAYLAMMAVRLIELHRVLKETGSIWLHCDPTASHYLKIVLDSIFGVVNYRSEIIWKRTTSHNDARYQFPDVTDTILFYGKSPKSKFHRQFGDYDAAYLDDKYRHLDESGRRFRLSDLRSPQPRPNLMYEYKGHKPHPNGWAVSLKKMQELDEKGLLDFPRKEGGRIQLRRYLDERAGMPITNIWDDIRPINSMAQERLRYPTQKPVALLERILNASSDPKDVVLDPFCGCGTTVHAAQKLGRRWIGIDVTHLAISLIERRLKEAFPNIAYDVHGVPVDYAGARDLAERDKHEFQKWITATIGAQPYKGGKKGMDRGIDGFLHFRDGEKKPQFAVISVKGGGIKSGDIRDLKGTMEREKAMLGLFLTLNEPTREMVKEAATAGFYETGGQKIPRLQILTANDILAGKRPQVPFGHTEGFKKAGREDASTQGTLI